MQLLIELISQPPTLGPQCCSRLQTKIPLVWLNYWVKICYKNIVDRETLFNWRPLVPLSLDRLFIHRSWKCRLNLHKRYWFSIYLQNLWYLVQGIFFDFAHLSLDDLFTLASWSFGAYVCKRDFVCQCHEKMIQWRHHLLSFLVWKCIALTSIKKQQPMLFHCIPSASNDLTL